MHLAHWVLHACAEVQKKHKHHNESLSPPSLGHSKRHQGLRREPLASTSMARSSMRPRWNKRSHWRKRTSSFLTTTTMTMLRVTAVAEASTAVAEASEPFPTVAAEVTRAECELANKTTQQFYKVSIPCINDHHFKEEELKSVGELSTVCSQIFVKCLYLARMVRLDILLSVNKLARAVTKWTKSCAKRLARLTSCCTQNTHPQSTFAQYSLFTSAERIARAWLKSSSSCSVFFVGLKESVSWSVMSLPLISCHLFSSTNTSSSSLTTRSSHATSTSRTISRTTCRQAALQRSTLARGSAECRKPPQTYSHK